MSTPCPPLELVFTLQVDLAPPLDYGSTATGDKRFIPITGGKVAGPKFEGKILPNTGGDWNTVRSDGVVHLYARYTIQAEDGTLIGILNEGYGRASQEIMKVVFEDTDPAKASMANGGADWYTRTSPRFEVDVGNEKHGWLAKSVFLGNLKPPQRPGYVEIDVYEVL
ncbi:uncharacterized protein N7496_004305 [Penicillium cataractarum]|uniref:Uncharacterized protein n=1 Tax=Penicillium cataractarum TaxID=2100454 RepID=A0A9W9SNS1_9EURO|nr:uncharacterized protein N7496_004305 [Penicillium cataractarum]KAJ5381877.1 hypothetical protein N7496_004305 [Penicillium cataractarum]